MCSPFGREHSNTSACRDPNSLDVHTRTRARGQGSPYPCCHNTIPSCQSTSRAANCRIRHCSRRAAFHKIFGLCRNSKASLGRSMSQGHQSCNPWPFRSPVKALARGTPGLCACNTNPFSQPPIRPSNSRSRRCNRREAYHSLVRWRSSNRAACRGPNAPVYRSCNCAPSLDNPCPGTGSTNPSCHSTTQTSNYHTQPRNRIEATRIPSPQCRSSKSACRRPTVVCCPRCNYARRQGNLCLCDHNTTPSCPPTNRPSNFHILQHSRRAIGRNLGRRRHNSTIASSISTSLAHPHHNRAHHPDILCVCGRSTNSSFRMPRRPSNCHSHRRNRRPTGRNPS
mmetsp:Transcript_72612/g.183843  ORF Transcript_72612/g.183843 Transcript_72612/m.183843 type:complete len:339 (-) Transcript_72612:815-1831(-)